MSEPPSEGLLYLLREEPTLLPPAPEDFTSKDIDHRLLDEVHSCLQCGEPAQCAYVADTLLGARWLDLCALCAYWLRKAR